MFCYKRTVLAALALSAAGTLVSCTSGGQSVDTIHTARAGHERAAEEPILGVSSGPGMPLPECDQSIVRPAPKSPESTARITIDGQQDDSFSYELTTRDGETVSDSSGTLSPEHNAVTFDTGVPKNNIHHMVISADGNTGVSGECVIHVGQRAVRS